MPPQPLTFTLAYGLVLSEEHYTAIGKVAAIWQVLEVAVQMAIWATLGLDNDQGKLATATLRFDTHLEIMGILVLTVDQQEPNPINIPALIKITKALQGERNNVVHGLWNPMSSWGAPESLKLKLKAPAKAPTYSPEQIIVIADQIYAVQTNWYAYAVARTEQRQTPGL